MAENKEEMDGNGEDDPSVEYEKQRLSFITDLKRFNSNRGTPFDRVPEIGGFEIDLYHLYQRVTSLGGWHKVNYGDLWEDFLEDFGLPIGCVNATQALKNIYFRYLNLYEKVNFLGEDPDIKDHDEEEGPARKKVCLPIETIPLNYNYTQHKVTEAQRQQCNLATELYVQKEYEKLEMSLRSGLPNEVDMAINVCVLLSTEGRHCMRLEKTFQLLRLLMAHVAVFEEDTFDLQELYHRCWMPSGDRNFLRFWFETVDHSRAKPLITWGGQPYVQREMVGSSVLNLGRDLGTLDSEGQRVLQLAVFLHNLSFEEANQKILARHYLVYKFLMLSLHSTYGGLRQIALDTVANLSCEIAIENFAEVHSKLLMDTLNDALFSDDRFFLVRGMEMMGKLSQVSSNEEVLLDQLRVDVYRRLVDLLTVQDIQLIVHTLEALYRLSKIGEPFTTRIARVHKAISVLVSLITIEAQSFGPGSLVGIKVVEYVPPTHVGPDGEVDPAKKPTTVIQPINPDSINIYQVPSSSAVKAKNSAEKGVAEKPVEAPKAPPPLTDIHATTSSWLNATYELKKKSKVNQVELFSDYLQFCRRFGITNAMSSADFLHLVKVIYHQCEVISINRKNGDNDVFLEGLSKRSTQKPFAVTTLPPEKVRNPVSVNVSPKQTLPHPVDSLSHTPTLRQRLMEPPRVPLSPHRYPLPGGAATSSAVSLSVSSSTPSVQASPKAAPSPVNAKGGRPQVGRQSKNAPISQALSVKTDIPASTQTSSPVAHPEVVTLGDAKTPAAASLGYKQCASQTHPSIQQALQQETPAEVQSVKSLLAKKLSHTGTSDSEQVGLNGEATAAGLVVNSSTQQPFRVPSQPQFRISSASSDNLHQNSPVVSSTNTSQAILIQQHHTATSSMSSIPSVSPNMPSGRFLIAQPPHSATLNVGSTAMPSASINSGLNQNLSHSSAEVQQKPAVPAQQNLNQNSIVQVHQKPGTQLSLNTTAQVVGSNILQQQFAGPQQNGPQSVSQVGQQPVQLQLRPSSANSVAGSPFVTQNPNPVLQNQNGPTQLSSSFSTANKFTVGQQQQQQQQNAINFVPGTVSIAGGVLRAPSTNVLVADQQGPCSTMTVQGTSLTQAISSPAVAALLTSNTQQGSSQQMIISSPMLGSGGQAQIMTRPPPQPQQVQQAPTTVVIQTPPGTIVMPSRQMQGGTVSFIVPPQYRQGSPVTFIQQQAPGAAGAATGVNMLPSLAMANSNGAGQQILPAQQRQVVLAPPGQTSIPVGMQLSSLQGSTIIRNHPVCVNSVQQQPPQQHNYVIQAPSSHVSASSQPSYQQAIPQQTPPVQGAGAAVSSNSESQLARSEVGATTQQSSTPTVVTQLQCNGVSHDQNGDGKPPSSISNDLPPSPVTRLDKEMLNGKCSSVDKDSEHIKNSLKLGGKVNGIVHSLEHSKDTLSAPQQANTSQHGTVIVNGSVPAAGQLNQHTNIPVQGLQIRSAGGMANGISSLQTPAAAASNIGLTHQSQQQPVLVHQQQQQPQQLLHHSQHTQLPVQQQPQPQAQQSQLVFRTQQQQTTLLPQPQLQQQQQKQQLRFPHQGQKQVVQFQQQQTTPQQPLHFQRVVSVRHVQQSPQGFQQLQGALRPNVSKLSGPAEQQQQQLHQALQVGGLRPAGLPRSGTAPTGEAGGSGSKTGHAHTFQGSQQTPIGQTPQRATPVSGAGKKRPPPVKSVAGTPVNNEAAGRLRKKKLGPNEVVVTPGAVQTRKQSTQGQKPVHIAMQYMCEWGSCRKCFSTARLVLIHVFKTHVPMQDSSCQWVACEKLVRKRWSLISHIQDHHCSEMAMRAACQRRYTAIQQRASGAAPTPPPAAPTPMIYPPDAAMQAIRRFSVKQPYSEFAEQREGPVSKHIRLTAALILRNICHASSYGRRLVRQHEEVLSYNTMNMVEASTALSHCLWEIGQCCDKDPYSLSSS